MIESIMYMIILLFLLNAAQGTRKRLFLRNNWYSLSVSLSLSSPNYTYLLLLSTIGIMLLLGSVPGKSIGPTNHPFEEHETSLIIKL
jgi:hypothetical protein